ncbi:MAG: hypothetical protein ACYCQM_13155 [Acidithiobacillus sp.]
MKPQASVSAVHQMSLFSWPLPSVRGGVALLFVLASLIAFDKTMMLLVWVFAIYMFFDGAYSFIGLVSAHAGSALNRRMLRSFFCNHVRYELEHALEPIASTAGRRFGHVFSLPRVALIELFAAGL